MLAQIKLKLWHLNILMTFYIVLMLMNTKEAKAPLVGLNKLKLLKTGQCILQLNLIKIKINISSRELKKL